MAEKTGYTIWLTGMSGAGKSTLAEYLGTRLAAAGREVEILDEEWVREDLMGVLEPTREARDLYMRRIGWVAELLTRNGVTAIVAATSPYRETRDEIRKTVGEFVEIFCDCPVETLIERDVKGLYKKALAGDIPNFTGITEPYEPPASPEVTVDSGTETVEESGEKVIDCLARHGYLDRSEAQVALFGKGKGRKGARRKPAKAAKKPAPPAKKPAKKAPKKAAKKVAKKVAKKAPKKTAKKAAKKTTKKATKKTTKKTTKKATGAKAKGAKKPAKRAASRTRTVSRPARRAAKVASRRTAKKRR